MSKSLEKTDWVRREVFQLSLCLSHSLFWVTPGQADGSSVLQIHHSHRHSSDGAQARPEVQPQQGAAC